MLSQKEIRDFLPESLKDTPIYIYSSIDSTNTECRRLKDCPLPFAVIAEEQTAGRGRQGKSFYSPKNTGLYLSLALNMNEAPQLITLFAAVAACRAIEELYSLYPKIKWVNDLYLNDRKICGILCEAVDDRIVIGIGINCFTKAFPAELKETAGSLGINDISLCALAARILENLLSAKKDFINEYRKRCFILGNEISFIKNGRQYTALAYDIDDKGNLLIRYADGRCDRLNSGEISIIKPILGRV